MKKTIFLFISVVTATVFLFKNTNGQITKKYQNPTTFHQIPFDAEIKVILENNTQNTISFFPLFKNYSGIPEDILKNKNNLLNWISDTCSVIDTADCILAMSARIAKIFKGDAYVNNALYPNPFDHSFITNDFQIAFAKNYGLGALLGTYSMQCGDYTHFHALLLHETGLIDIPNHVRAFTSGIHVFPEVFHNGSWKITDCDPGTSVFMTKNGLGRNDLQFLGLQNTLNTEELAFYQYTNFTGKVKEKNIDIFTDSIERVELLKTAYNFLTAMDTSFILPYPPIIQQTYDIDGDIILPPDARLEVSHKNYSVFIDSILSRDSLLYYFGGLQNAMLMNDSSLTEFFLDKLAIELERLSGINKDTIKNRAFTGDFNIVVEKDFFPFFQREDISSYTIVVPPGTYQIGADIKAPGRIMEVVLNGSGSSVYLEDGYGNDTLITTNNFRVNFWGTDTNVYVPNNLHYFFQQGSIVCSDTVRFKISWNPNLFPFIHGELGIHYQDNDTLDHQYLINGTPFSDTIETIIVSTRELSNPIITIYPNPTTGTITITGDDGKKIITDLSGHSVYESNENTFSIKHLPSGMYIISFNGGLRTKIIKQ